MARVFALPSLSALVYNRLSKINSAGQNHLMRSRMKN